MLVTRIAPTPSGYLHLGNAVNFLLTAWLAEQAQGRVALRIDDIDLARRRTEYLDDIFATIDRLGLHIDGGPRNTAEHLARYSQSLRIGQYRDALTALRERGLPMYRCPCSRRELAVAGGAHICRDGRHNSGTQQAAWRAMVSPDLGTWTAELGDFVVWRRDDLPSYQLTSVVDDEDLGTTLIVRGIDLQPSTQAQLWLAAHLGAEQVLAAEYVHHPLVLGPRGEKLSKSAGAESVRTLAGTAAGKRAIFAAAVSVAGPLGIPIGVPIAN